MERKAQVSPAAGRNELTAGARRAPVVVLLLGLLLGLPS